MQGKRILGSAYTASLLPQKRLHCEVNADRTALQHLSHGTKQYLSGCGCMQQTVMLHQAVFAWQLYMLGNVYSSAWRGNITGEISARRPLPSSPESASSSVL